MGTLKDLIIHVHPRMKDFVSDYVSGRGFDECETYEILPEFQKSAAIASGLRKLGNEAYQSKNYDEALLYYSKSVAAAPTDSVELALAFGNRSSVLQLNAKYALCLLDVNRALKEPKLPDDSKQKLVDRKIECWALLQSENEAKHRLRKALKTKAKRALYPTERRWFYAHQMTKDEIDFKMDYASFDDPIWKMTFDNAHVPGLSPKVELAHNDEYGCHLIATNDIKAGEIISIQEVFTLVLLLEVSHDLLQTYCSYCTMMCEALIPCSNCTVEMYCSRACRQNAYDSYHRTECKLLPYLMSCQNIQRRKVWLAMRIFLAGTKQGLELEKLMLNPDIFDILSGKKKFVNIQRPTNDYFAILHTLWSGSRDSDALGSSPPIKVMPDDLEDIQNTHNWLYSFELLEHIHFFDEIEKNLENPDHAMNVKLFAGLLLLHHTESTKNTFYNSSVELMTGDPRQVMQGKKQWVATTFGLLQGFMNHSCNCNSFYTVNRRKMLTYSSRLIKSGEQIFTNYGKLYKDFPKPTRSEHLIGKCGFECKCEACLNDWPTEELLIELDLKYKTKDKNIIKKLNNHYIWLVYLLNPSEGVYEYKDGDLQKVLKCNQFIQQHAEEPSPIATLCEGLLCKFMGLKGNCYFPDPRKAYPQSHTQNIDSNCPPPEKTEESST